MDCFSKKSRITTIKVSFNQIMERITGFLKPVVTSIINKTKIEETWNSSLGQWKK